MPAVQGARRGRWGRRLLWASGIGAVAYGVADVATDSSLTRSLRAFSTFFRIAYMYKSTTPETPEEYFALHKRAAELILYVCTTNEGAYVKVGQGLNAMNHILPREYTETLKVLLDNAPPVPFADIRRIIYEETGKPLEEVFESFEENAVASASIAQVHRARLCTEPGKPARTVAVKVRKPCISKQSKWDIRTYNLISYLLQALFGLPTGWARKTIVDGLTREMDFTIEAANADRIRRNFAGERRVYIPEVYHQFTTPSLLVLEWVDATKLLDVETVKANYDHKAVLRTLFDAFGDMVFKHGFVHSDPHGANVLVRPMPDNRSGTSSSSTVEPSDSDRNYAQEAHKSWWSRGGQGKTKDYQVIFIDFGLCVPETERFRMQYALLFQSLLTHNIDCMLHILSDWGISDGEVFASMLAQKPIDSLRKGNYGEMTREEVREMQNKAHTRAKKILLDEAKIPRELPLVGRGVDIMRGLNRLYGSPLNRINMFVKSAVQCLGPLHDYEGVRRYLDRMQKLSDQRKARRDSELGSPSSAVSSVSESVYDDAASLLREEQAAVVREMAAEQSAPERFHSALEAMYRMLVFRIALLHVAVVHCVVSWYNWMLGCLLPPSATSHLRVSTLEDRVAAMESSQRIR